MSEFPDDFDGDTLRLIQAHGVNLDDERDLEFIIEASDVEAAEWAQALLRAEGAHCVIETLPDGKTQEIVATFLMRPNYENVVRKQRDIAELLAKRNLVVSGWGTSIPPKTSM